ncbi:hypothetical protein CBU02nite_27590 [Clostridium butyricum]|uniref:Replication-associated protein ORF2/G2P domain-containing protein n=1 Tax=Clostridium butyricum TaxID=1492 RepID=A0A512TQ74_CLOBU|nr:hypothetical protein [Clostridium butyricum]MDU6037816.1 hypothetical protein [Clostridium butyricum]NOW21776.1 hypothetical protein [Clostridium butyricum]GEQ22253.1 hypothetical protein CBU02nite_27590 [Clostridium butyricum]
MKKKQYDDYRYEEIFDKLLPLQTYQDKIEDLRMNNRYTYIVKTTTSGNLVESEVYPVYKCRHDIPRAKERKESRELQKKLNDKNSKKRAFRLIQNNFDSGDLFIELSYDGDFVPDEIRARKDIKNYIERLRRYRRKHGLPELKYIYSIGFGESEGKKIRIHHHIIINKMDRDIAEKLWGMGRANSKRLQPDSGTGWFEEASKYIAKQGKRRWAGSKNLKKPKVTTNRTRLTKRKVEKLVKEVNSFKEKFEGIYQNCDYRDTKIFYSDIVSGFYIYTRMKRRN